MNCGCQAPVTFPGNGPSIKLNLVLPDFLVNGKGVNMKKLIFVLWASIAAILLAACSNSGGDSSGSIQTESYTAEPQFTVEERAADMADADMAVENAESGDGDSADQGAEEIPAQKDRVIIYHANLSIEVKNYDEAVNEIESKAASKGGYVVESTMHGRGDDRRTGYITLRIPQEHFPSFLQFMEEGSFKVLDSNISGEDVTEEYVDLESRLKSKRVVEERLLAFMEEAEKTEDLLKISNDLAKVQEEIDQIVGRMKYLENKSDLATVTIHIEERNVSLTGEEDLNTWERTAEQFKKSLNFLMSFFSGLVVYVVGGFPIIAIVALIGLIIYYIIRKQRKKDS